VFCFRFLPRCRADQGQLGEETGGKVESDLTNQKHKANDNKTEYQQPTLEIINKTRNGSTTISFKNDPVRAVSVRRGKERRRGKESLTVVSRLEVPNVSPSMI